MENYEKLLDRAYEKTKVIEGSGQRFEIPQIKGHFQGKKTILTNFKEIAEHLRRTPLHLQKYLLKQLAAKGHLEGDRLVLNSKISSKKINPKIEQYTDEFVLCKECGKPDTELMKDAKMTVIHCLACGARHPVRTKI